MGDLQAWIPQREKVPETRPFSSFSRWAFSFWMRRRQKPFLFWISFSKRLGTFLQGQPF
jgi:hypothetical protein